MDNQLGNLTDNAYRLLKHKIVAGEYRQGTAVSISAIARNLNISRTPVTYACLKLEHDKLVTIVPKQGVVINSVSVVEAREIYELRAAVEFYSALRSYDHIDDTVKRELYDSYQRQVGHIRAGDIAAFMQEDMAFHKCLLSVLKNSQFLSIIDNLSQKAHLLGLESLKNERRQEENLVEHKTILDRMESGDRMEFACAIEANILNGLACLLSDSRMV